MIKTVTPGDVQVKERESGRHTFGAYLGSEPGIDGPSARGPQAFVIEFCPGYVVEPHFHWTDQFQVFVKGHAAVGQHLLDPVSIHYTDSFTPYGPITVGDDGTTCFVLRGRADLGAQFMPGSADKMQRKAGRALYAQTQLSLTPARTSARLETLIEPQDDGLAVFELVAGPGAGLLAEIVEGSCRYQLVIDGSLEYRGTVLPRDSVVVAAPGDRLDGRRAGPTGVHLLELQLPAGR